MRLKNIQCFGLIVALFSFSLSAQETAKILPKGISRARTVMVFGSTKERYNNQGDREFLAAPLNRTVTISEMAKQNATLGQLYNALNSLEPGLGDSVYQTNLYTDAKMSFQQYTLAYEVGLSKRWNLGVIIPYTRLQGKATFKAESQNSIAAARARAQEIISDEQWNQLQANLPNTTTMENSIFLNKGYKPVQDFKAEGLGDIEVGGKYNAVNLNDKFYVSLKSGFRLPTTSHVADERNILDQSTGDNQLDYALQVSTEYFPVKQWSLSSAVQGTLQLPNMQGNKALLKKGESGLPDLTNPDNRDNVKRDLGDVLDFEAGTTYGFFSNTVLPSVNYSFYYKQADKYSGGKAYLDYETPGANTQAHAHRAETGLKFSTIPLYAKKRFPVPFETKASYLRTLAGKNVVDRNYYRFDLILYF